MAMGSYDKTVCPDSCMASTPIPLSGHIPKFFLIFLSVICITQVIITVDYYFSWPKTTVLQETIIGASIHEENLDVYFSGTHCQLIVYLRNYHPGCYILVEHGSPAFIKLPYGPVHHGYKNLKSHLKV